MTGSLETAYAPFRATLLTGDFQAPDRGEWPAEFVAAHVAINNDQIADAAERVVRGQVVAYDNALSVDENELSRFVERVDGLVGLAEEIQRSAARLDEACGALGDLAEGTFRSAFGTEKRSSTTVLCPLEHSSKGTPLDISISITNS